MIGQHIPLRKRQSIELALRIAAPANIDLRHAAAQHPGIGPGAYILPACRMERPDQVGPLRVAVGMLREVKPQAVAKVVRPEAKLKLLQDRRGLLVHDGAVGALGILQVRDVLEDGRGAGRLVNAVGKRLDALVEVLPRLGVGLERVKAAIRHVLRKALFEP